MPQRRPWPAARWQSSVQFQQSSALAKSMDSTVAGGGAQQQTQGPRAPRGDAPGRGVASAAGPHAREAPLQTACRCSAPRRAAATRTTQLPHETASAAQRHTCLDDTAARHCRRMRSSAWSHAPCVTAGGYSAAAAPALRSLEASGRSGCTGATTRSMPPPSSCCVLSACVGFGNSTGPGGRGRTGRQAEWRTDASRIANRAGA